MVHLRGDLRLPKQRRYCQAGLAGRTFGL